MGLSEGERSKPAWVEGLMGETFFAGCGAHQAHRKNEKNIFCLDCCLSFCPHCLPDHRSHPLLQVRRYVYHDVVRLVDLQKLMDCSFIQAYTINGAKVIFLKQRTQSGGSSGNNGRAWRAGSGSGSGTASPNLCFSCDRILQPPFHFCSLSCKVDHMLCQGGEGLTSMWMSSPDALHPTFDKAPAAAISDPDTDAHTHIHTHTRSAGPIENETPNRTSRFLTNVFSLNSRRKQGAPHRAPLS